MLGKQILLCSSCVPWDNDNHYMSSTLMQFKVLGNSKFFWVFLCPSYKREQLFKFMYASLHSVRNLPFSVGSKYLLSGI